MQPNLLDDFHLTGLIITIVIAVGFTIPAYLIYKLKARARARAKEAQTATERRQHRLPERAHAPRRISCTWFLLVPLAAVILWQFAPRAKEPALPQPLTPEAALFLITIAFLILWYVTYVGYYWLRYRDPLLKRAAILCQEGNHDAAIALLSEAMDARPTPLRANMLATLMVERKDWPAAYKWLLLSQELGLPRPMKWVAWNNMCVVLRGMGRFRDALDLIEPHALRPGATLTEVCNYIEGLTQVGRLDDAWDQIVRAEELLAKGNTGVAGVGDLLRKRLDECRVLYFDRIAAKKGGVTGDHDDPLIP